MSAGGVQPATSFLPKSKTLLWQEFMDLTVRPLHPTVILAFPIQRKMIRPALAVRKVFTEGMCIGAPRQRRHFLAQEVQKTT